MTTVRDLLEQLLPSGTSVVAGERGLAREVTWATGPKPSPPAFGHVKGQEIVLFSSAELAAVAEHMTLEKAIRHLAERKVAAIAFQGRMTAAARSAADETGVAFLQLPGSADLSSLEREISHFLTERRREAQRKGPEVGRRLMELAIAGESVQDIVSALAEFSGRSVALETRDGRILAFHHGTDDSPDRPVLDALLQDGREVVANWLRMAAESSPAEPPVAVYPLDDEWNRAVAPVGGREGLLGVLSVLLPGRHAISIEESMTSRGAAACAVAMARDFAARAARREIELNVLDEVLDGALRSEVSLIQQAKRLGHDLQANHVVFVVRFDQSNQTSIARSRENRWPILEDFLARRSSRLLWRIRHNSAEIVWPVADAPEARTAADAMRDELERRTAGSTSVVSIGVGQVRAGLAGIQRSHQEARQALVMGRRLHGAGGLTRFEDLGVYRLIFAAEHLPELDAFYREALGDLIAYDREHSSDLLRTLKAFFDARGGPKEAAGLLDVHRNTVLYRLDRIKTITGLDLDDADVRLRLHLALSIHLALHVEQDDR